MSTEQLNPVQREHFLRGRRSFHSRFLKDIPAPQQEQVGRFANNVFEHLSDGKFSHLTLFQGHDELGRKRLILYMEETGKFGRVGFSEALADLSLALRPETFFDVYYSKQLEENERLRELRKDVRARYGDKSSPRVLWQFSPVV